MNPRRTRAERPGAGGPARAPLFSPAPLVVLIGRGGVGKTTCAAGAALADARGGRRVLVASIDPAHSLGDALDAPLGEEPRAVRIDGVELHACELDAGRAWTRWLDAHRDLLREALARGTWFAERDLEPFLDLSPAGLTELTALLELERLASAGRYERVVVDPAPSGHLPRLLEAPALLGRLAGTLAALNAKHGALARTLVGAAADDPTARAIDRLAGDAERLAAWVRDPARCAFVRVVTPDPIGLDAALAEVEGLVASGVRTAAVVLQRDVPATSPARACARCRASADAARDLEARLAGRLGVPLLRVPELAREPRGDGLAAVARALERGPVARPRSPRPAAEAPAPAATQAARAADARGEPEWIERVDAPELELLVVAGKGGVGKTTCAAAAALALARRRPVLLLSVDPAHGLAARLDVELGDEARSIALDAAPAPLLARELDAARAFEERRRGWKRRVEDAFAERLGGRVDARYDREALASLLDLAPPGIDALGALLALVDELAPPTASAGEDGPRRLIVLDTPATGHVLELLALPAQALTWVHALLELLLAQPEELRPHDLARELLDAARELRLLIRLLGDPRRARCLVVTRRDDLPRLETVRLAEGLERLGLAVAAVVVNASVRAVGDAGGSGCARCRRARRAEEAGLAALRAELPPPIRRGSVTILAPEEGPAPVGPRALAAWARAWRIEPDTDTGPDIDTGTGSSARP